MKDPKIDTYAAEVRLIMNDGQNLIHRSDDIVLRGPGRPMNEEELFQKFNDCAKGLLNPKSLQYLFDMLRNFETNVQKTELSKIAEKLTTLPNGFNFLRKIERLIVERKNF